MRALPFLLLITGTAMAQEVPSGWVNIVSLNSGLCLDMSGGPTATSPGVSAQQWTCLGTAETNQIFQLIPVSGGYEIQVMNSGLAIGPLKGGTANGTAIEQFPYRSSHAYQTWIIAPAATSGYYTFSPASDPSSCMDVSEISTSNGAQVWEWGCWGGLNQEWELVPVSVGSAATVTGISPNTGPTSGGTDVTITGTNFASGATVSFGNSAATDVQVLSSSAITAVTPAGNAGAVAVSVAIPGVQTGSLANAFTYIAPSVAQTIAYVQGNYAGPQTPQLTVTVPFNSPQSAGDLNVVVAGWNDGTAAVNSVTDSAGNTYQLAVGPTVISGTASQSIYYATNVVAGANAVTVTFSVAAAYPDIRILEYQGADQNSPLDGAAANSGNSASSSSGAATTSNATDLLVGANLVLTSTSGPGNGFTQRLLTSPDGDIAEDEMTSNAGSYTATAPLSSPGPWIMQMAAFRTPSGTGSPPVTSHSVDLTWTASTTSNVVSYNVYRGIGSGALSKLSSGILNTVFTDNAVVGGQSYTYAATAVDSNGNESVLSNTATVTIPNN